MNSNNCFENTIFFIINTDIIEITDSPPNGVIERHNSRNTGSLRRKTKSAGPSLRSSYEAYEERTIPALRQ